MLKATEPPTKRALGSGEFDAEVVDKVNGKIGLLGRGPLLERRVDGVVASESHVAVVSGTDRDVGLGRADQEGTENPLT